MVSSSDYKTNAIEVEAHAWHPRSGTRTANLPSRALGGGQVAQDEACEPSLGQRHTAALRRRGQDSLQSFVAFGMRHKQKVFTLRKNDV
eukprot:SAG11_NODE_558_length_8540_cov_3.877147_7_plen_89_part_00